MFARKLGRLAGSVLVLVFAFGGVSLASAPAADDGTGAAVLTTSNYEWD